MVKKEKIKDLEIILSARKDARKRLLDALNEFDPVEDKDRIEKVKNTIVQINSEIKELKDDIAREKTPARKPIRKEPESKTIEEIDSSKKNLQKEIITIFQFSNMVVETKFSELLKGNIQTTYGTDFNCIAQSILERGFDKAIIITDGYASMTDELQHQLLKQKLSTLTILFDNADKCDVFEPFGEIIQLENICSKGGE